MIIPLCKKRSEPRTHELTLRVLGQFALRFMPFISAFTHEAFWVRGKDFLIRLRGIVRSLDHGMLECRDIFRFGGFQLQQSAVNDFPTVKSGASTLNWTGIIAHIADHIASIGMDKVIMFVHRINRCRYYGFNIAETKIHTRCLR